jgi:hypothetical protein
MKHSLATLVLASSMKLAYPLNDVLPNVEHTRHRLLAKIFEFRRTGMGKTVATDEDYELLYAYGMFESLDILMSLLTAFFLIALVTGQLAQDLEIIGQEIEKLRACLVEAVRRIYDLSN